MSQFPAIYSDFLHLKLLFLLGLAKNAYRWNTNGDHCYIYIHTNSIYHYYDLAECTFRWFALPSLAAALPHVLLDLQPGRASQSHAQPSNPNREQVAVKPVKELSGTITASDSSQLHHRCSKPEEQIFIPSS